MHRSHAVRDETRERLLEGIPVADRRLELAGASTAVLDGGDGPPVVLLHSSGEFGAIWLRVIPELTTTNRVIVPDLPGHGASEPLAAERALDWLGELIGQTCLSAPALVGHGLGGALGARFAIEQLRAVRRLVLVDAMGLAAYDPAPSFGSALQHFLGAPTGATRDALFRQCFVDLDEVRAQLGAQWAPLASYALDRVRAPGMEAALAGLMPAFGLPAIAHADLARIAAPTALIWGRHDRQVRLTVAEDASARHGWPLHVIENAGDDPALEQPAAFLHALYAALTTMTGTTG